MQLVAIEVIFRIKCNSCRGRDILIDMKDETKREQLVDQFNDAIGLLGLLVVGAVLVFVVFYW